MSKAIRQFHRWVSLIFALTGLYLFVLPYLPKRQDHEAALKAPQK